MKIGILTFHYSNHNFGAVLQAFSMYKLIELMGHEPYIVNFKPREETVKKRIISQIQSLLGFKFEMFRRKHISNILQRVNNYNDLKKLNGLLDGFIVGSDQVWRNRENKRVLYTYFLDFVEDDKLTIAYAASFGLDYWDTAPNITAHIKNLLSKFDAISVREETGVKICNESFSINCQQMLDPTLVLDKKYFHDLANLQEKKRKNKYLAYMLLDDLKQNENFFKDYAKNNQLDFVRIKGKNIYSKKNFFFYNSIYQWLNDIKNAELVITDSFHCTVFAIIFRKQFFCITNPQRGVTRLQNLLAKFNLETRLASNVNDLIYNTNEIDYKELDQIIASEKKRALDFLKKNIGL